MNEAEKFIKQTEEYEKAKRLLCEQEAEAQRCKLVDEQACVRQFDALVGDLRTFRRKLKPTEEILCEEIYQDLLHKVNDRFTICGEKVRSLPFHADNVFSVAETAKKQTIGALKILLDGLGDVAGSMSSFARGYNTIVDVEASSEMLKKDALDQIARKYAQECQALNEKKEKLEAERAKALSGISGIIADNERTKDEVLLRKNFTVTSEYSGAVRLPFGYRSTSLEDEQRTEILTKIAAWDLNQDAVFHVKVAKGAEEHVSGLIENMVLQFFKNYPVSSAKIAICNPFKNDQLISFFGRINNDECASSVFFGSGRGSATKLERSDIEKIFGGLNDTLSHRLESLGEKQTVLSFNAENRDTAYPLILLVLDGYSDYYKGYRETLNYLFSKGVRGGIYTLVVEKETKTVEDRCDPEKCVPDLSQMTSLSCRLSNEGGKGVLLYNGESYSAKLRDESFSFSNALNTLSVTLKEENKFLPLKSILNGEVVTEDFSQIILIPVGKSGSREIRLGLDVNSPEAHVAIAGATGSGKSSLLQNIILGGAYLYSPDELHFWILDFKDGAGLSQFQALKHVKRMSLKNRTIDAMEIMGYIEDEYKRRAKLIRENGGGDIVVYNEKMRACSRKPLPRLIIVIDEFTQMPPSCTKTIAGIAQQGRSFGMSLILCSQIIDRKAHQDVVGQATQRFEFKSPDAIGHLIGYGVSDADKSFVNGGAKGNCLYQNKGIIQMRAAYAGECGKENSPQEKMIEEINEKWKDYPYEKPIITGAPERRFRKIAENSFDAEEERQNYRVTKQINIPIGVSRLGKEYRYTIDRNNQVLIICGNEKRATSLEYSIAARVAAVADDKTGVYYFDFNLNADRETNVMLEVGKTGLAGMIYARSLSQIGDALDKAYEEFKRRKSLMEQNRVDEIGNPIEIIIHNAERIPETLDLLSKSPKKTTYRLDGMKRPSFGKDVKFDDETDIESFREDYKKQSSVKQETERESVEKKDDVEPIKKLQDIVHDGKNFRMFLILQFEDSSQIGNTKGKLFPGEFKFKDIMIIPSIPDEGGKYSGKIIGDYLTACGLNRFDSFAKETNADSQEMTKEDFYYVVLVDDNITHKIIPYEWEDEIQ